MNKKRPVNLDLSTLKYPPMAIVSILHRISGVVLFLLFPIMLYLFSQSLHSDATFHQLQMTLANPYSKLLLWVFSGALMLHVLAGIRHVLMDIGFGEGLLAGRRSAISVMILAILSIIFLGIWIW